MTMNTFKQFYIEAKPPASVGKLELHSTDVETAYKFASGVFDVDVEIPDFKENYKSAKTHAQNGRTQRKDMPRITSADVKLFQQRLERGELDVSKPIAPSNRGNPFPEGLTGKQAKIWLSSGLNDGDPNDDITSVKRKRVKIADLLPIQKQIYVDTTLSSMADVERSKIFLSTKTFFIISADNYIIDGHHRYLSALLIDPNMKVNVVAIDLPIDILLKVAVSYGDAIGNKRNK